MSNIRRFNNTLYCSFCGRSQQEVAQLIAGPSVYICDACVEQSWQIVTERRASSVDTAEPRDG